MLTEIFEAKPFASHCEVIALCSLHEFHKCWKAELTEFVLGRRELIIFVRTQLKIHHIFINWNGPGKNQIERNVSFGIERVLYPCRLISPSIVPILVVYTAEKMNSIVYI